MQNKDISIPYGRQYIDQTDIKAVVNALKSPFITQGPRVKEFEFALCAYTGAKYSVCVSSGTAALHLACLACEIKEGDEVITSPITFLASANCALYCSARPVFADIEPQTANISLSAVKKQFNSRTKVVVPVHFAGCPVDMPKLAEISRKYKAIIIEDAAHALGAEVRGKSSAGKSKWLKIGNCAYSAMAIFSFHPVKSITTAEGGAVLTNNKKFYEKLLMLRSHGVTKDYKKFIKKNRLTSSGSWYYQMQYLGFNYRMPDINAALGISQLKKLDKFISRRREIAAYYHKKMQSLEEINLPSCDSSVRSAWHLYVVKLKGKRVLTRRKKIFEYLRKKGIGVQVHYIPVYLQPFYQKLGYKKGLCPQAEDYYQRAFSLPLFSSLTRKNIDKIVNTLKDALYRSA